MPRQYLYNVEFTIEDLDLWCYPDEFAGVDVEELPTFIRFKMNPLICLEINEDEFFDQINCDKKIVKNSLFSLNEDQLKQNVDAHISVSKLQCREKEVLVGSYRLPKLNETFNQLMEQFDKHASNQAPDCKHGPSGIQPCSEIVKELVQLVSAKNQPSGSLHYVLRLTCFGPTICKELSELKLKEKEKDAAETMCLDRACHDAKSKESEFDEYSAEVNGNQLIVRIHKGNPHLVTRVFDSNMKLCGNEKEREKNLISIKGCDQQIDFKFPKNFSCGDCKGKSTKCGCESESMLTDFQRQTSCIGKSFKNSSCLPVIRGNLKYPGKMEGFFFDLYDKVNPLDATEKLKRNFQAVRNSCTQGDEDSIKRGLNGPCSIAKGIEICKKGCSDPDTDVFILKIGSKKTDRKGRKNDIELEMRTPKGPDNEVKKKETREIQVDEKEFEDLKKDAGTSKKKESDAPKKAEASSTSRSKLSNSQSTRKGFVKK